MWKEHIYLHIKTTLSWHETFAVNVRGSVLMTREFVKYRHDYGRIINVSTHAAQIFAGQITYGASKATLEALTRSIALEVTQCCRFSTRCRESPISSPAHCLGTVYEHNIAGCYNHLKN